MFPDARILDVDLSSGELKTVIIPGETYRLYPGGSALALYLIMREMDPKVDPLGPDALMAFTVSPLTGLPFSGNSRVVVAAKSPLTGTMGDSQGGGYFPAQLKANDWDGILVRGQAKSPVYLYIEGEHAELKPADHLWGKGLPTGDVEDKIKEELNDSKVEIAQIGSAGENQVRYACILSLATRANGRNGMGAVMGSKKLKAVVVKRAKPRQPYDKESFSFFGKNVKDMLAANDSVSGLGQYGTAGDTESFSDEGFLPTRNWQTGYFPQGAKNITGTTMYETILKQRESCYACSVRCKRAVEIPERGVDPRYGGPEYETVATFGSYCDVTSLADVSVANQLCNMYGMDTISAGATVAFAMECYEKGLLDKELVGDLDLSFGNGKVFEELLPQIALRNTKLGDLLAEGSARAAAAIGQGAEAFFMGVKKQEFPAHMPQWKPAVGVVYAVNPFGADHQSSEHDFALVGPPDSEARQRLAALGIWKGYENNDSLDDEKVRFALETQIYFSILDTLCLCQFVWGPSWELYGPIELIRLCKDGIGWETSMTELMKVGERRINMMRWFNAQNGFTKADDKLPERIFKPMPEGPSEGHQLDKETFYDAVRRYYIFAGWDPETGNPTDMTLRRLSLGWLLEK